MSILMGILERNFGVKRIFDYDNFYYSMIFFYLEAIPTAILNIIFLSDMRENESTKSSVHQSSEDAESEGSRKPGPDVHRISEKSDISRFTLNQGQTDNKSEKSTESEGSILMYYDKQDFKESTRDESLLVTHNSNRSKTMNP